jgi:hypothetical protein
MPRSDRRAGAGRAVEGGRIVEIQSTRPVLATETPTVQPRAVLVSGRKGGKVSRRKNLNQVEDRDQKKYGQPLGRAEDQEALENV